MKEISLKKQLYSLSTLLRELNQSGSLHEKIDLLNRFPVVKIFFHESHPLSLFFSSLSPQCEYVLKAFVATNQKEFFQGDFQNEKNIRRLRTLLAQLLDIEHFYQKMGGIVGYQLKVLERLLNQGNYSHLLLLYPPSIDLQNDVAKTKKGVIEAIKNLDQMAEIYPVGGAADRLQWRDETGNNQLPAAHLPFLGRALIEGVIRDLHAWEYLHYKLFHRQVITPIAMMTSQENGNREHIEEILDKHNYFGRPKTSIRLFCQPSVPTFTQEGKWCLKGPMELLLKPGGHGALWKLSLKEGIFDWFKKKGRSKLFVRQINNPIAGVDNNLLAFIGIGHQQNADFGFASCPSRPHAREGMIVLKKSKGKGCLTNIEYCDFEKFKIQGHFPANTNLLFGDLDTLEKEAKKNPYPGLIINFRESKHHEHGLGTKREKIARLESLMQNIADGLEEPLEGDQTLLKRTYLTINKRRKTISVTKKQYCEGELLLETPEGCLYDHLQNCYELLKEHCQMDIPPIPSEDEFLIKGPPFLFSYHPTLGPLFSIIGQKISKGKLAYGSEIQCEIADLKLNNLELSGSLLIIADQIMGHPDEKGILNFSNQTGKCILKNIKVYNRGFSHAKSTHFWKNQHRRQESLTIILHKNAELYAENVTFTGNHHIEVPQGKRLIIKEKAGQLARHFESITDHQPMWTYHIRDDEIKLL